MDQKLSDGALAIQSRLKQCKVESPSFHIVLGSGFKDSLSLGIPTTFETKCEIFFADIPGLHPSTAPGHDGKYVVIEHKKSKKVGLIQVGRLHGYEGLEPKEVVRTVLYSRELGTTDYFITNAAGGIDPNHKPGDVMIIEDHINFTGKSPLYGENPRRPGGEFWGARFPDLSHLYHKEWRALVKEEMTKQGLKVHHGIYMGVLGPAYETPAEVRYFRQAGTHAVGMSTVWETIALKHTDAKVCAISLISNVAAGLSVGADGEVEELDHFSILNVCKSSSTGILKAILLSVEKKYAI